MKVQQDEVVSLHDVTNMFHVPLLLAEQGVGATICRKLNLQTYEQRLAPVLGGVEYFGQQEPLETRLGDWFGLAKRVDELEKDVRIAVIGKYTGMTDSYMSVVKALHHASIEAGYRMELEWIESTELEANCQTNDPKRYEDAWRRLKHSAGVLVPGAFGNRGVEGMILAAKYCRENNVPYFGICVGLQVAVIEAVRHVLGHEEANSTEFNEATSHPSICVFSRISERASISASFTSLSFSTTAEFTLPSFISGLFAICKSISASCSFVRPGLAVG